MFEFYLLGHSVNLLADLLDEGCSYTSFSAADPPAGGVRLGWLECSPSPPVQFNQSDSGPLEEGGLGPLASKLCSGS